MVTVNLINIKGTWRDIADSARTTIGLDAGKNEPSSDWKKKMLRAEHSPIRQLLIKWIWNDLPWWVQTHFTRHKIGVEWYVKTSRSDRTGIDRSILTQNSPINVEGIANAQAIINISRKRLCNLASKETREAWKEFLKSFKDKEPELYSICVPECIYRNGLCPEYKSCGWNHTKDFEIQLKKYIKGLDSQINKKTNIMNYC